MANFNVGDVVKLNSGGPQMTVEVVPTTASTPEVIVVWFDVSNKMQSYRLPSQCLELVPKVVGISITPGIPTPLKE